MSFFGNLERDKYDRTYGDDRLLRRIWDYFRRYKRELIGVVVGFTVLSFVSSLRTIVIALGVDALETADNLLVLLIGALFITGVLEYYMNYWRRLLLGRVIGQLVAQMRKDAFDAALHRDLAFYDTNKTGKIVSRITGDTQEFADVMLFTSDVVAQLISVVVILVALVERSLTLTVVLMATMPLFLAAASFFRVLARRATRQGSRAMAVVNDNIQESVTGISVAKNFRREAMIYDEFVAINTQSYRINLWRGFVFALIFPVMNGLIGISIGVVVYVGAQMVLEGVITAGAWFLFIQAVDRFFFPVINLASFWSQLQAGLSAAERVFALIDAENTVIQREQQPFPDVAQAAITFKDVTFAYNDGQPVLKHFNLHIREGENVAFVGHTGSGKSTIAKLVARFYEFQDGDILIDGRDIRTLDLESYRSRLGLVPQQPFLFSGTILQNIRYARPEASDEEIEALAHSIGGGEWLETLPNGLHSDVGERGARLSMGQRQLVSLLRVMVQKPAIFILDEATASVDPFTEVQIQEAIDLLLRQSTSILIAHRLSTVRSADRIIVLKDGNIIEEGNHDALMAQGGHYAELYNTYFRHQSLSYIENARTMLNA